MTKNKILIFGLLTLGVMEMKAQEASVSAGGDATGAGGSVAYSVGQVVYTYQTGSTGSVNQGVQQPYELLSVGLDNNQEINLTMSVYPNPSVSVINLNVGKSDLMNLSLQLFDLQGKLLYSQNISNLETSIKMDEYNSGSYLLNITQNNELVKTFKIIKN